MKAPHMRTFSYILGNSLYIPLTSRCNTLTLPQTRGPNFLLPNSVILSLLQLRQAEIEHGCFKDDIIDDNLDSAHLQLHLPLPQDKMDEKRRLPPPLYNIISAKNIEKNLIANDKKLLPITDILHYEIQSYLKSSSAGSQIVFAGEGEPTLELNTLLSLSEHVQKVKKPDRDLSIRIVTNGLVLANAKDRKKTLETMKNKGIDELSVALMTACPTQYDELMQPNVLEEEGTKISAHGKVCILIRDAVEVGLNVECTGVEYNDFRVDTSLAETLSRELGANSFRWRPYFP